MIKEFLYKVLCGFVIGISMFAPGFSGSVMSIIMGVYQDIIRIASNPFKDFKKNVLFCIPLGIGAIISAVLFVITFKFLFDTYEKATYLLFVGLIFGNLPIIFTEIKKYEFQKKYVIGGISSFVISLILCILAIGVVKESGADGITVALPMLGISGFITGASLLIPGLSVATVLLMLGVYSQLIYIGESLIHMNFTYLALFIVFVVCTIIGVVIASRGIKYIFEKFPGFANTVVFGFMIGSLIGILIHSLQISDANFNWLIGTIVLAAGIGVSLLFVRIGRVMNKEEQPQ